MKFLTSICAGIESMLSETGKVSVKRWISAVFAVCLIYLVCFFLNKPTAAENQATLKYLFTGLCAMILLLTGVATIKDIIALKSGKSPNTENIKPAEPEKPITE